MDNMYELHSYKSGTEVSSLVTETGERSPTATPKLNSLLKPVTPNSPVVSPSTDQRLKSLLNVDEKNESETDEEQELDPRGERTPSPNTEDQEKQLDSPEMSFHTPVISPKDNTLLEAPAVDPNQSAASTYQSPFKTPVKGSEEPSRKHNNPIQGLRVGDSKGRRPPFSRTEALDHEGKSTSTTSQTSLTFPLDTSDEVMDELQSFSQTLDGSPAPPLNYRTISTLVGGEDISKSKNLFKGVNYSVTGEISTSVKTLLGKECGNAKKTNYFNPNNTHVIMGSDPDMNDLEHAKLNEIPIVDQNWVVFSSFTGTLLPLPPYAPSEGKLLAGVVACLDESFIAEEKNKIWAMLTWHGGQVVTGLHPDVTHIIVQEAQGQLYTEASSQIDIKIVTSNWVSETVKKKTTCDETLYHPRTPSLIQNNPSSPASSSFLNVSDQQTPGKPTGNKTIKLKKKDQLASTESEQSAASENKLEYWAPDAYSVLSLYNEMDKGEIEIEWKAIYL